MNIIIAAVLVVLLLAELFRNGWHPHVEAPTVYALISPSPVPDGRATPEGLTLKASVGIVSGNVTAIVS